jgi:hypothetical protein
MNDQQWTDKQEWLTRFMTHQDTGTIADDLLDNHKERQRLEKEDDETTTN